jgi:hypothetical protein
LQNRSKKKGRLRGELFQRTRHDSSRTFLFWKRRSRSRLPGEVSHAGRNCRSALRIVLKVLQSVHFTDWKAPGISGFGGWVSLGGCLSTRSKVISAPHCLHFTIQR